MIKVKIRLENSIKLTIPLPYFSLYFASSLICSNYVWKRITRNIDNVTMDTTRIYPPINKKLIKPLLKITIKEFQNYRGTTILNLQASDGTKVSIKL